jgi:hypothetical protein
VFSQTKYSGSSNDCDSTLLPPKNSYEIIYIKEAVENTAVNNDSKIALPCEVLYEINTKRKDFDIVEWKINHVTLIRIFPKNKIIKNNSTN